MCGTILDRLGAGSRRRRPDAQRPRRVLPRLGDKAQDWLVALLALALRVIALASSHLITEERVDRGVGIDGDRIQPHVGCRPHPLPHALLHGQQLPRDAQMQRGQKAPEGRLWRQLGHRGMPVGVDSRFRKRR